MMLVAGIYQHDNQKSEMFPVYNRTWCYMSSFLVEFVFKWFMIFLAMSCGVQLDILSCWMNCKPYLRSVRARAIFLFFACTQCLTLWSSGYWIRVTDAIAKQPVTAQGSLGTQTVRKSKLSGSIHHCSFNYLSMEARQRKWCWIRWRCL